MTTYRPLDIQCLSQLRPGIVWPLDDSNQMESIVIVCAAVVLKNKAAFSLLVASLTWVLRLDIEFSTRRPPRQFSQAASIQLTTTAVCWMGTPSNLQLQFVYCFQSDRRWTKSSFSAGFFQGRKINWNWKRHENCSRGKKIWIFQVNADFFCCCCCQDRISTTRSCQGHFWPSNIHSIGSWL